MGRMRKSSVRTLLSALIFAAAISFVCGHAAAAAPATAATIREMASSASAVQRAQYAYRRTKHGFEKCYHRSRFGARRQRLFSSVPYC
jgi:hypothetical protein